MRDHSTDSVAKHKKKKTLPSASAPQLTQNPFAALAGLTAPAAAVGAQDEPGEPVGADLQLPAKLVVRREKKGRGGKTVTRISGLSAPQRDRVIGALKKALGCSASAEGEDLLLHGALVDRAARWLTAQGAKSVVRGN